MKKGNAVMPNLIRIDSYDAVVTFMFEECFAIPQNQGSIAEWERAADLAKGNSQEIERMGKYNLFKTVLRIAMCKGAKIKMVRYLKNGGIEFTFAFADQRNMEYFTDVLKFQMVL